MDSLRVRLLGAGAWVLTAAAILLSFLAMFSSSFMGIGGPILRYNYIDEFGTALDRSVLEQLTSRLNSSIVGDNNVRGVWNIPVSGELNYLSYCSSESTSANRNISADPDYDMAVPFTSQNCLRLSPVARFNLHQHILDAEARYLDDELGEDSMGKALYYGISYENLNANEVDQEVVDAFNEIPREISDRLSEWSEEGSSIRLSVAFVFLCLATSWSFLLVLVQTVLFFQPRKCPPSVIHCLIALALLAETCNAIVAPVMMSYIGHFRGRRSPSEQRLLGLGVSMIEVRSSVAFVCFTWLPLILNALAASCFYLMLREVKKRNRVVKVEELELAAKLPEEANKSWKPKLWIEIPSRTNTHESRTNKI